MEMEDEGLSTPTPAVTETCIDDLPNECLVNVLSRVGNTPLPLIVGRNRPAKNVAVKHPLQCAFVCRLWRSLASASVRSLFLDLDRINLPAPDKEDLSDLFPNLVFLTLTRSRALRPYKGLLACLERLAPRLETLDLRCWITGATVLFVARFLAKCGSLRSLRAALIRTPSLTENLVHAWLDVVCGRLPLLTNLSLEYAGPHTEAVWSRLGAKTSLEELHLKSNVIPPPPPSSNCIPRVLRSFDWAGGVEAPSQSLEHLVGLEALSVRYSQKITTLPESLGRLSCLTRLEIDRMDSLLTLPRTIGGLGGRLRVLSVTNCLSFDMLPEEVGELVCLRTLRVDRLGVLPDSLRGLTDLRGLYIKGQLTTVPDALAELHSLQSPKVSIFTLNW